MTKKVNQYLGDITQHQIEQNLRLLNPIIPFQDSPIITYYTDPNYDQLVKEKIAKFRDGQKKIVFIFCGTGGSSHPIPEHAILGLIEKLSGIQNVVLYYSERKPGSPLETLSAPHVLNITQRLDFPEFVSWINQCNYYIGADTGPTHIASFLNKPVLFFSPKKNQFPTRWGPWSDYFKILREDIQCQNPCLSTCAKEKYCARLHTDQLTTAYYELLNAISLGEKYTPKQRKIEHLKASFRIAYCIKTREEFEDLEPVLEKLREKGVHIFPVYKSLRQLMRSVVTHNITVIQGECSGWKIKALRFYMGTLRQYIKPVHVPLKLHRYIKASELIALYLQAWERER